MKYNLFPTTPAIPITLGRFVMRACALSSEICDKKDIFFDSTSEDNFYLRLSMLGVVSFHFQLIHGFPNLDWSIDILSLVEEKSSHCHLKEM